MKKLLYILFAVTLFTACSSDDDNDNTPKQDYTSFTIVQNAIENQPNTVVGYLVDGKYKKLAELGDLKKGVPSKEVRVDDKTISEIYIFTDYNGGIRFNRVFKLVPNAKNNIEIPEDTGGIAFHDKTNPERYPQ